MFLSKSDLNGTLYPEIRNLLSRFDDTVILSALSMAEHEIETYLTLRFDIRPELEKTGTDRHRQLLSIAVDMAIYRLYQLAETIPAHRERTYDRAVDLLKMLGAGKAGLAGVAPAPVPTPENAQTDMVGYGADTRRPRLD